MARLRFNGHNFPFSVFGSGFDTALGQFHLAKALEAFDPVGASGVIDGRSFSLAMFADRIDQLLHGIEVSPERCHSGAGDSMGAARSEAESYVDGVS